MSDIFQYTNYRKFLTEWIAAQPKRGRGMVSAFAKAARCQPAYFSRVISGLAQLSMEQAYGIQKILQLPRDELEYFLLVVEWDRAGDTELKAFFFQRIESTRAARTDLQNRFKGAVQLTNELQRTYYSSSQYAAVHACISVPALQTVDSLVDLLRIPRERILVILEFLLEAGLALREGGFWKVGSTRLHLGRDSDLIRQHHANWRIEALKSLDRGKGAQDENDLHYSAVVSLSHADATRIQELWIKTLQSFDQVVAPSKEETVRALVIDFFALG